MASVENADFYAGVVMHYLSGAGYRVPERSFLRKILSGEGRLSHNSQYGYPNFYGGDPEGINEGKGHICVSCMCELDDPRHSEYKYWSGGKPYFLTEAKKVEAFCDFWKIRSVGAIAEAIEGNVFQPLLFCVTCEVELIALIALREHQDAVQRENEKLYDQRQRLFTSFVGTHFHENNTEENSRNQVIALSIREEMVKNQHWNETNDSNENEPTTYDEDTVPIRKSTRLKRVSCYVACRTKNTVKRCKQEQVGKEKSIYESLEADVETQDSNSNLQVNMPSCSGQSSQNFKRVTFFNYEDDELTKFNIFGRPFEVHESGDFLCLTCFYAREPIKDFMVARDRLVTHIINYHFVTVKQDLLRHRTAAITSYMKDLRQFYDELYRYSGMSRAYKRRCELCNGKVIQCFLSSHIVHGHMDFRRKYSCQYCTIRFPTRSRFDRHNCPNLP